MGSKHMPLGARHGEPKREKPYRDYALAALSFFTELAALRYGTDWLAWVGGFLFWLAVLDYTKEYSRKTRLFWATCSPVLLSVIISFLLVDPVRGPFAHLAQPRANIFTIHAGIKSSFTAKQLGKGIDFTQMVHFSGQNTQPVELWMQRRWPFRLHMKATVFRGEKDPILIFDDKEITYIAPDVEVNYDDKALELMAGGHPIFQVIVEDDYDVYVNAFMMNSTTATIMNGDQLEQKPINTLGDKDFLTPLFRYPAYSHHGERE